MIFPWHDLVTMRAALVHRSARYTEQTEGETVRVELDGTAIASLLELTNHHGADAQSGMWADTAIAAVLAAGMERDVIEAAGLVADSAEKLDLIAACALHGPVVFSTRGA
jgi:hypothetical protein